MDKDLKPNDSDQKLLDKIAQIPDFIALSEEQKRLVWRYRFSLTSKPNMATKMLFSCNWNS